MSRKLGMGNKALIFDISTKRMKEDGMTDSEISKVYNIIAKELHQAGFDDRIQHSVYRTTNGDGINALINLLGHKERFPLFCQYKERVHWMGCDEYSDVTKAFDIHKPV
jgi:virulence-associated protein VapD